MTTVRHQIPHPAETNDIATAINALSASINYAARTYPQIGDGGTNGRLRTNAAASFAVAGALYTKASTDDLWNLSAQTSTTSGQYRAIVLYLDASGTATIGAGSNATSAAAALLAIPSTPTTKSVIGIYVAGPSTNFSNALAAQGTIYNGLPIAAQVAVNGSEAALPLTYVAA